MWQVQALHCPLLTRAVVLEESMVLSSSLSTPLPPDHSWACSQSGFVLGQHPWPPRRVLGSCFSWLWWDTVMLSGSGGAPLFPTLSCWACGTPGLRWGFARLDLAKWVKAEAGQS